MFGLLLGAAFAGERITARKIAGLIAGVAGVALVARPSAFEGAAEPMLTRALTVTYLIPLFAMMWGMLFLGETLTAPVIAGGVLILAGTVLVTRG